VKGILRFEQYLTKKTREIFGLTEPLSIDVKRLPGDASDREFFRTEISSPQGPYSFVLLKLREPLHGQELDYVNVLKYLNDHGVCVPELYFYDEEMGLLFLEDLGDETLEAVLKRTDRACWFDLYCKAIDALIRMQINCSQNSASEGREQCVAYTRQFDTDRFSFELNFFKEYLIQRLLGLEILDVDDKVMTRSFREISFVLDSEKKLFSHRDYHSRNLLIHNGEIKMVDFQDARLGLCQYDLASLLRDSYIVLSDEMMERLLEYYITQKEELTGERIDRGRFRVIFDYTSIQRNLKACGTFAFLNCEKKKSQYLQYIPDTLRYVKRNLQKYKELHPLYEVLTKYLKWS
jgi:hypothetical protein